MISLMNRSIDLLEELACQCDNRFHLSRRGYLYVTGKPEQVPAIRAAAEQTSALGAGSLRLHTGQPHDPPYIPSEPNGYSPGLTGADLILDSNLLHKHFPALSAESVAALHVRRAGWFSAQQLGAYLLEQARSYGVQLVRSRLIGVETSAGRVAAVRLEDGSRLATEVFVNAAGPLLCPVGRLVGVDLPVITELHLKAAFKDTLGIVPRTAPLLIWTDAQKLEWSEEESDLLKEDVSSQWLLGEFPSGVHTRPEGGPNSNIVLMLWEYKTKVVEPAWPIPLDPDYPEIALRGLASMLPGLRAYFGQLGRPALDGGYYTRTHENRPLIGPLPVQGAYVIGALSGYGLMAASAAGELLAKLVTGAELPAYAPAFSLERYQNPTYMHIFDNLENTGQALRFRLFVLENWNELGEISPGFSNLNF